MPIYEFACKGCQKSFKTLRRTQDLAGVTCPDCKTDRVVRLLSVTAQATGTGTLDMGGGCGTPMGGG